MTFSDSYSFKYNYVFIFPDTFLDFLFNDLITSTEAQFICQPLNPSRVFIENNILSLLCRTHFSYKLNYLFPLPFKHIWCNKVFNFQLKQNFDKFKPFCFIINARYFESYGDLMVEYLRRTYYDCKIICYFIDLIQEHSKNILQKKHLFDAFFSFEESDANKYGFIYMELPYSHINIHNVLPKSDLFFIGSAKNRLKIIHSVYKKAIDNGLKCDFFITNTNLNDIIYNDGIIYNKNIEYAEVLQHINSTQCILEILQDCAKSPTIRPLEAVCYNKKLLTNCSEIKDKPYYKSEYMSIFSDPNKIDIDFLKKDINTINYNYVEKLSPLEMIKKIDNCI